MINALVSYRSDTMTLVSARPFERETASTSHFDGIVVNGLPINDIELKVSADGFRERLEVIASSLERSATVTLVPLS
ncbi:MAG: hypothetical protein K2H98_04880 [Duncaniella sp.]|nr:hypothetical protein [Duncaniella sp.]